jgi:NAD+ kinase
LVVSTRHVAEVRALLREVLPWLRKRIRVVGVDRDGGHSLREVRADLVVVLGGDGTILSVARRLAGNPVPVLGVNLGRMGFLAEVSPNEFRKVMPKILRGRYLLSPRMMLRCRVMPKKKHGVEREYAALNDVVIQRNVNSRTLLAVRVAVSGEEVATHMSDGLIVATATGSTAYNLSAGGPILSERLKAFTIVPICPHTLANRPIVLSGEEVIQVAADSRGGDGFVFVVDGCPLGTLPGGSQVEISRAPHEFNLVTPGTRGRYEIIRDKLNWAGWVKDGTHESFLVANPGSIAKRKNTRRGERKAKRGKGKGKGKGNRVR